MDTPANDRPDLLPAIWNGHTAFGSTTSRAHGWEIPGHVPKTNFRVRVVRTLAQMQLASEVRRQAYASKLPELASQVGKPESLDYEHNAIVLLVDDRTSGEPFGTLRLNSGPGLLDMMSDIALPTDILESNVAYISRLALLGTGKQKQELRFLIQKSIFQLCAAKQLRTMLILAVIPRERLFLSLGFSDVFDDAMPRHPAFLNHVPVRALRCETYAIERIWREHGHPLYDLAFRTFHPEIEIFSSVSSLTTRSDKADLNAAARSHYLQLSRDRKLNA